MIKCLVMKQYKLLIVILLLSEICVIKRNNCCFIDGIKLLNVGMPLNIYDLVLLKLDMMIDSETRWP